MSLIVHDLFKKYGEKVVVDHLSFEMSHPGVYALLGTNGAGKTTSIRMILGILARDGGEVLWNGEPLTNENCNIGYLAEERGLYPKYPLMDQLMYFASLRGVPKDEAAARIRRLARKLEVTEYLYTDQTRLPMLGEKKSMLTGRAGKRKKPVLADQLSKGNQQKIQFMTALLSDPELIVLDEPLSGLDPVNTDIIREIIHEEIEKGKYLIMSSHQMATVEEFCTDLTIMNKSKTVLTGNLNEIKKSYGRINLHLKVEGSVAEMIMACGISILSEKEGEYQLRVAGDEQAELLLHRLVEAGVPVITYDRREPSLHEIFVEKVGDPHEE